MQKRFQMMLAGAFVALGLMVAPVAADPQQSLLERDRVNSGQRRDPSAYGNRIQREKGQAGLIFRTRTRNFLRQDKGFRSQFANQALRSRSTPLLSNDSSRSLLNRNRNSFFARRPLVSNLRIGKANLSRFQNSQSRLNRDRPYPNVISPFRSTNTSRTRTVTRSLPLNPVVPQNSVAAARAAFHEFFAQNSIGALFIQRDPRSGQTYRLQFAQAPITRQVDDNRVAVRCSFYGQTSASSPSIPVVVEYTMTRAGQKSWDVKNVQFVSVNGQAMAGAFDINDADLAENEAAADLKEFPTKTI